MKVEGCVASPSMIRMKVELGLSYAKVEGGSVVCEGEGWLGNVTCEGSCERH